MSFLTLAQYNSLLLSRIFGADCFLSSPAFPRFLSLEPASRGTELSQLFPYLASFTRATTRASSRSSCYTPSSTPAPLHARTPCLHLLRTLPRLTSGLRRQQGQREVYINSPAPTHTSLATLNNFLLSANN